MSDQNTHTPQVDESKRNFLKALVLLGGAALVGGGIPVVKYLNPPPVGLTAFPTLLLVDSSGNPIKASALPVNSPQAFQFNYPLLNEPNFLLNLGDANNNPVEIPPTEVVVPADGSKYPFPGGVGPNKSIVAYSGICQHLGCKYPELHFYPPGYPPAQTFNGSMTMVIHCSCHGSTYDPYKGGAVITGPTTHPLPAVVLQWDPSTDELYATRMVGPVIYGHTSDLTGGNPITGTSTEVVDVGNPFG
ncbi:(2Fe-2S)-binding protein [Candidatus Marsarchaeota G2 archaeon BE_D]|jgi:Rieske Fe-S protein|uniref:(2Fe-2S)-binding protein n=4 Tax=Candidatus Marsarchaeota group 2 TaxID=2203771 RepID=A0A2R6BT26_9ARCH|nr:MAG: (2Fe-2S)-binding protein [Candidatus Marsarchaeota G2 archaeon ECH_B_2]PSO00591.1 MAG: (2Fe-2S)-binding protein [Candidatus Marsarchaeota G2 archaeon ECH_B_3]PSO01793.1 MAG: (2Fe-2S)-binding protein [Candidatus Marsarchaeota G2 archaeon BE_D]PSO03187.1 MAG: (2Fe-2S)-binding protein [Candidatus Marsarchaeota G2 archaeon ECH_B_1]